MQINRSISYTSSWQSTLLICLILSAVFSFILVFLQPFDTYDVQMPYKNLKLVGYAIPITISILVIHFFENKWFSKQQKWLLWNELIIMGLGLLLITFLSFVYLNNFVNTDALPLTDFFTWLKIFGLPFAPLMLILWTYLRFRFSKIEVVELTTIKTNLTLQGDNSNEVHHLNWNNFLLAKAQSNYVEIISALGDDKPVEKRLIRSSLSKIAPQIPQALQVHRSYLINKDRILRLEGNSRKGWCFLKDYEDSIPVSPKHFKALKIWLQNRP